MNKKVTCCFAGHSDIYDNEIIIRVKTIAETLITEYNVTTFLLENYGNFDKYAFRALNELRICFPDIQINLVLPYMTKEINEYRELYYKQYDSILLADIPANTPKKLYILKCNKYMVDNSDFLICYIERTWGGALKTFEYAKRKKLKIFNIKSKQELPLLYKSILITSYSRYYFICFA